MGRRVDNLVGQKFGKLTALYRLKDGNNSSRWVFLCECGSRKSIVGSRVKRGEIKSCGCYKYNLKHGHAKRSLKNNSTSTYNTWLAMKRRCLNPDDTAYINYGGRGITIDERWKDFNTFLEDMGESPENKSLDRIDNDKGYSASNCRWADIHTQARNRRGKTSGSSCYKGVVKFGEKWRARIRVGGSLKCLGLYSLEEHAAAAYNRAAIEAWGPAAYLNTFFGATL